MRARRRRAPPVPASENVSAPLNWLTDADERTLATDGSHLYIIAGLSQPSRVAKQRCLEVNDAGGEICASAATGDCGRGPRAGERLTRSAEWYRLP